MDENGLEAPIPMRAGSNCGARKADRRSKYPLQLDQIIYVYPAKTYQVYPTLRKLVTKRSLEKNRFQICDNDMLSLQKVIWQVCKFGLPNNRLTDRFKGLNSRSIAMSTRKFKKHLSVPQAEHMALDMNLAKKPM